MLDRVLVSALSALVPGGSAGGLAAREGAVSVRAGPRQLRRVKLTSQAMVLRTARCRSRAGTLASSAERAAGARKGASTAAWVAATALGGVVEVQALDECEWAGAWAVQQSAAAHPALRPLTGECHAAHRWQGVPAGAPLLRFSSVLGAAACRARAVLLVGPCACRTDDPLKGVLRC